MPIKGKINVITVELQLNTIYSSDYEPDNKKRVHFDIVDYEGYKTVQ